MTTTIQTSSTRASLVPALKSTALTLAVSLLLGGCYSTVKRPFDEERHPEGVPSSALDFVPSAKPLPPPLPLAQRQDAGVTAVEDAFSPSRRYSFKAQGAPLRLALSQFAQAFKLNIVADQDVGGVVTVNVNDLSLDQSLDTILDPLGLGWWRDGTVVHVSRQVTRSFVVDYARIKRNGSSSSSGSGGGSSGSVSSSDSMDFWGELEKEIKDLMKLPSGGKDAPTEKITHTDRLTKVETSSEKQVDLFDGHVVINKSTGMVQVTTSPKALRQIEQYMKHVLSRMNKQVYIEMKIMEVTLRDDNSFGIDWTKVLSAGGSDKFTLNTAYTVTNPMGSLGALAPSVVLNINPLDTDKWALKNLAAAVTALEAQGDVKVISQPRIRTLNNQAAIIKTGTERTFYTQKVLSTINANGFETRTVSDEATTKSEGILLTVVPQIGTDNVIALDVTPSLTKIVGVDTSPSGFSSAPRTETNQITTLVRVNDGQTAVIGGMIIEEESETKRQLPSFGSVPLVGWLGKGAYNNRLRKELVIFITPHVISN